MALIYLSSTYEDLKEHRRTLYEALRKAGHQVIGMEDYVAMDQRPVDRCLSDVEQADVYIGLLAYRYGYIPPPQHKNPLGLSITELEYRCAEASKKPCLLFVVDDKTPWPREFDDAYNATDKGAHIQALRQHVLTEKLTCEFSTPHELSTLVLAAVSRYLAGHRQPELPKRWESEGTTAFIWNIEEQGSPYPGLMHFTQKYAPVFFGREAEVLEILDRMYGPEGRFIIISGDSGVGKSSLVDAGLLPALEQGRLTGVPSCRSVRMVPSQRQQPLEALVGVLGALATKAGVSPDALLKGLTQDLDTLGAQITCLMKTQDPSSALVLFIDQMEELFTSHNAMQTNHLLSGLYKASAEHALWVITTIRSDHLHYCHRHPDMLKVLNGKGHYALGSVEPYMMQDMILKPAHAAGLMISEVFAKRLIRETEAESANLPLLAFVLDRLFQQRTDCALSEGLYDRLGRVSGAIGVHILQVEADIEQEFHIKVSDVFPILFQTLANVQKEEGSPTPNRPKKSEFLASLHPVIERLVNARLLRTEGQGEEAMLLISHEKLFEAWPALREYVETHRKTLLDRTLLESRAKKWAAIGKPWTSGLATGREYHDFQRAGRNEGGLVKEFLCTSRRARRWGWGAGLILILLLTMTTWFWLNGYPFGLVVPYLANLGASAASKIGVKWKPDILAPVLPEMMTIRPDSFQQGDTLGSGEVNERPVHPVTITKPFKIGKFEVTFKEYDQFAIATKRPLPSDQRWGRERRPVINVSWNDANAYADWLSENTGDKYRLPTESEWEYAARSAGKQDGWAGTSKEEQLIDYAVYRRNLQSRTEEVGERQGRKPNALGLYDMTGNVWEWVQDCWHSDYKEAPNDGLTWKGKNDGDCDTPVRRGGSWYNKPKDMRVSSRSRNTGGDRSDAIGFRLAQDLR